MKNINIKLLLNRVVYDPTNDLKYISDFLSEREINITWNIVKTDIKGYGVRTVTNPMGNLQTVLDGAEPLVTPFLSPTDNICVLAIEGVKEFGNNCPSESTDKSFLPGTKTTFCSVNADDFWIDAEPNFRVWLMHEVMHALGTIATNAGFPIVDCMDVLVINGRPLYYYSNQTPEYPNSNFINQLERLQPWIDSVFPPIN